MSLQAIKELLREHCSIGYKSPLLDQALLHCSEDVRRTIVCRLISALFNRFDLRMSVFGLWIDKTELPFIKDVQDAALLLNNTFPWNNIFIYDKSSNTISVKKLKNIIDGNEIKNYVRKNLKIQRMT